MLFQLPTRTARPGSISAPVRWQGARPRRPCPSRLQHHGSSSPPATVGGGTAAPATAAPAEQAAPAAAAAAEPGAQAKHAVVVGAGPAGALAALKLAEQGFRVTVFERLLPECGLPPLPNDPQQQEAGSASEAGLSKSATLGTRSYHMIVSERALHALDASDITLPPDLAAHYHTAVSHRQRGGPRDAQLRPRPGRDVLINRGALASSLVRACQERFPDAVAFRFGWELVALDAAGGSARFGPAAGAAGGPGGELVEVTFDLLVGADGARSATRALLQQQDPELQVEQTKSKDDYKAFSMGPAADFMPADAVGRAPGTVHTWLSRKVKGNIIAATAADGTLMATLVMPRGVHESLGTAESYVAWLQTNYPSIPADRARMMAEQLASVPPSLGGLSTRCNKLASGRVALVGDAGHSVWPTIGHGANSAIESAAVLAAAVAEAGGAQASGEQLEAALASYSRERLPDAHAVVDFSERAFQDPLLFPRLLLQSMLNKLLPFLVPAPALLQLHATALPYSTLYSQDRRERAAFLAGLAALGVAALAWLGPLAARAARPVLAAAGCA